MNKLKLANKQDYAHAVCLFLAEGLRSRKMKLERAVDIAQKVVQNINLVDTEEHFLKLVKELANDFDELVVLEKHVEHLIRLDERTKMEKLVKEYAATMAPKDLKHATAILQEALKKDSRIETIMEKFEEFKQFVKNNGHKS